MTADGGAPGPYPPPGGPFTPQPVPSVPDPSAFGSGGGRRPRGGGIAIALSSVAIMLAVAALVVAIVRGGESSGPATPTAQPTMSSTPTARGDTTDADKALCEAIAPLIKESSARKNVFVALGPTGTPERDAGVQDFRDKTQDWAHRAQEVLDKDAAPPRYFTRTLERYIDDMRLIAANLRAGPATESDTAAWNDSLVALAGPFEICGKLGIPLW